MCCNNQSNVHEILHIVIITVDCVDMYKSFVTLYKPTIKYFMSYYKYTSEELTEGFHFNVNINKDFWRGFAELAKTLKLNINYSNVNNLTFCHLKTRWYYTCYFFI